ncbi:MAG: efflux RND transporter permease subunit [Bacteroidota bacterium]
MAKEKDYRSFGLTELAVDNATSIFILAFMILLFGLRAYDSVPKEQFPEVQFPQVYVNTPYFGNSAEDIESLVTRELEKELQSVDGMKTVRSTSIQDFSVITVEFNSGEDIDEAVRKVKDAVDQAKPELPNDLDQEPTVLDINFAEIPIVTVNVSGEYTLDELIKYAEYLQDEIETLDEVARAEIKGDQEREVKIDVDLRRMESMQVSFTDIENAIASENLTLSSGEIVREDFRRAVRVVGEFEEVSEIENMIVKSEDLRPIYLKDIATVTFGYKDRTSIARADRNPVVSINVIKKQGENLLSAADKLKEILAEAQENVLPADLDISLFNDQSDNTREQVSNLENSIISGVILVTLVLLFFLGLRNALFVGIAIPLSMLMGILFIYMSGVTLNIVVLFGLILALGLLVDNGIVVIENIYRYVQEGYGLIDAAKQGAGEVALPIIASTATTLAAFVPIAFWPGLVGSFMQYLPITLIIVLTSSLVVALVINPVFAATFMKVEEIAENEADRKRKSRNVLVFAAGLAGLGLLGLVVGANWLFNLMLITVVISLIHFFVFRRAALRFQNNFLPRLERGYDRFVNWALSRPGLVFAGTFALLFFAIVLLGIRQPKVDLFPTADPLYVNAFVELPLGTDIEKTNRIVENLEEKVTEVVEPYGDVVQSILTQIGEDTADPNGPPEPGSSPNRARLTVSFVPSRDRGEVNTFDVMEEIREVTGGIPGVSISVDKNADGPPTGKPINLELQGEDMDQLAILSEEVINYINGQGIPGIEQLQADVKIGKPELIIKVDREAARRYGISTFNVASTIRTALFGKEVSKYKVGEDDYPIFIRLNEDSRASIEDLTNQRITFRNPANGRIVQVPISAVADVEYSSTYSSIKRKDLDRVVTIFSNVRDGYNANEIVAQMTESLESFDMPTGYTYEFTGEQQQQAEDTEFLSGAFLAALFFIFIILVAQFNSITAPFIIILSVLFSTIGVFLGYAIFRQDISIVFTGVGIISLAGVVVNNAIVLIDYINLLVKQKREEKGVSSMYDLGKEEIKQSIIKGGATRLRPVLLTAITTVLGLIPLAVGFNFDFFSLIAEWDPKIFIGGDNQAFWGPMAWTVIYGLTFATFLTLVVIPVMYWLAYNFRLRLKTLFSRS